MGLIDTDLFVDYTRGSTEALGFLKARRDGPGLRASVVTTFELICGCRNRGQLAEIEDLLSGFRVEVIPLTSGSSQLARGLLTQFALGHGLGMADALIAATALEHGLPLYTRNTRDFRMIPDLTVLRPY